MTVPRLTPTQYLLAQDYVLALPRDCSESFFNAMFAALIGQPSEQISDDAVIAACEQAQRRLKSAAD
jgi:hypothetical protein